MVEYNAVRYGPALAEARDKGRHAIDVIEPQPLRQLSVASDNQRQRLRSGFI
jgi:hypothetical protein